jgi:hypothetical protein
VQVARACAREAEADRLLALAVCANEAAAADRATCARRATRALAAEQDACQEQRAARERVCAALGDAPYDPPIRPADFVAAITNPLLPLLPGTTRVYRSGESVTTVTVLRRTRTILGVRCTVVRDTVAVDGEIEEDTLDYFAQDRQGNVWYFGEDSAEYANGVVVSTDGSWLAGVEGAKPGIVMPAAPRAGLTFRQEFALDEAEDVAQVVGRVPRVRVPFGTFTNVLRTLDFTPLEPDAREAKLYAAGIGPVLTIDLESGEREVLVSVTRP